MTRTKSSRALVSVVLAVLMAVAFMPAISYTSFAATAKKATKVTKVYHTGNKTYTRTVGSAWTLKYKLSPSKLTTAAKKVVWKSSNKSVVNVSAKSGNKAAVSFKKVGTATVTVYTKANKKAKATWKFKVVPKSEAKKVAATGVTVAADNSTDYTKTLQAGTVLTASVAPADATGVTYQWYADGEAISGATAQKFTVTTDQIGKEISVKATDDSKNTVESAKSAKVSDVTLTGVTLQSNTGKDGVYETAQSPVTVGTTLKVAGSTLTGASKVSAAAGIKWIRTIKSANGTSVDTTVAENTDTYKVTKEDLAAKQNGATVTIKAEVTPNANVKAYGTTNSKFTAGPVDLSGAFTVSIQANGKDVASVKAGTKLTAVVTPSDVKVTYQWYKDGKQIAGATSAEYTPTEDGTYRVHVAVAADETTFDKNTHKDASVKVGGKTIEKVVLATTDQKDATPASTLEADAQWMHGTTGTLNDATYTWYRNGVKLDDSYGFNGKGSTYNTLKLSDVATKTGKAITTADSFYCVVTGTGDFLSDPVTSNTVKVASLGDISVKGVATMPTAKLYGKTVVYATGMDLSKYNVQVVVVKGKIVSTETVVDSTLNNHAVKETGKDTYAAADKMNDLATDVDLTNENGGKLYLKLTGTNGYTGTVYVPVSAVKANTVAFTATPNKDASNKITSITVSAPKEVLDVANATYQWQFNTNDCKTESTKNAQTLVNENNSFANGNYSCVVTIDGVPYTTSSVSFTK